MSYTKLGIIDFEDFCRLSIEGDIILIETDAGFEEILNEEDDVLTVKVTVLEFLVYTIIPEQNLIIYYAYPVVIPDDLSPEGEALSRFERIEREKLIEKLKKKIGAEKKYVPGVLSPPEVEVNFDYGAVATMVSVLRDSGVLNNADFDGLPESEIKICPACNSELANHVKTCLVCGYTFESRNFR
ncbi:MAG: hypothetical protein ACE5OZ_24320 [Candidatus Heimdallarchaeota archaeon]